MECILSCGASPTCGTRLVADRRAPRRRLPAARQPRSALSQVAASRGRVVVSGGGLAGMLTTLALRNIGFDATCYDRGEDAVPTHSRGLQIWPFAVDALRMIDETLCDALLSHGDLLDVAVLRNPSGELLRKVDLPRRILAISSDAVLDLLQSRLPSTAVVHGHTLETLEVTHSPRAEHAVLCVLDAHGSGSRVGVSADILVGADGLRSRVRSQLHAPESVVDAGSTAWRGSVRRSDVPADLCPPGASVYTFTPDGRTMWLTSLTTGGGFHGGTISWVLCAPSLSEAGHEATPVVHGTDHAEPISAEHRVLNWLTHRPGLSLQQARTVPRVEQRIRSTFHEFTAVKHLMGATQAGSIVERRLFHRAAHGATSPAECGELKVDTSGRGPVTLVGDAAHMCVPSLGLGACLTIQGVANLMAALDAVPPGSSRAAVEAALRQSERTHSAFVSDMTHAALEQANYVARMAPGAAIPDSGAAFQGWLLGNARRGAMAAVHAAGR